MLEIINEGVNNFNIKKYSERFTMLYRLRDKELKEERNNKETKEDLQKAREKKNVALRIKDEYDRLKQIEIDYNKNKEEINKELKHLTAMFKDNINYDSGIYN